MRVDLFDFDLPASKIAQKPVSPRHAAKLLRVTAEGLQDSHVSELPKILTKGDLLVFNNSKVIPSALRGRVGDKQVSLNLHKKETPDSWRAFVKPAKHAKAGAEIIIGDDFTAKVIEEKDFGERLLKFSYEGDFLANLQKHGEMPLPPYIKRPSADKDDAHDYQTIFAEHDGAVAAPTAGLHFSETLLGWLREAGIATAFVTLHVGGGTFLPVRSDDTDNHQMHSEFGEVSAAVCDAIRATQAAGNSVVAVGTTTLRILEAAASGEGLRPFCGDTDIFITPGYRFATADKLLTNFHLPRSTLFMLVSAFSGLQKMQQAYAHAIAADYRFFSYGDACLLDICHAV